MAEDVAAGPPVRPAAEQPAPSRAERAHTSAYYSRFTLAYTLLGMVAAAGIGVLVLVLLHSPAPRAAAWSKFVPTGSPLEMERQIATRVSSEYEASTTSKLVTVYQGPLEATRFIQTASGPTGVQVPITLIAVQPDVSTGKHQEGDYSFFHPESTVGYSMCGFGDTQQHCGVTAVTGRSPARLLHREALELVLYTLKYVPGTDAVVVYFPPPENPQAAATALFVARKDVKPYLRRPLSRTLQPQQVVLGAKMPDAAKVFELTRSRVYSSDYQTLPGDGTSALVLTPQISAR